MSKTIAAALAGFCVLASAAAPALAQTPSTPQTVGPSTAPAAGGKLSADSTVAALLANPAAKAVLQKHVPIIVEYSDMIPELDKTTLRVLGQNEQASTMGGLTADAIKAIDADLAKL